MNNPTLAHFTSKFLKLRRDSKREIGKAPHKPILLLAILEMVRTGELQSNRVVYNGDVVGHFRNQWMRYVTSGHWPNSALPFFHMRSEGKPNHYWRLVFKPGMDIPLTSSRSIRSPRALEESLEYAEIDLNLFHLMCDPVSNQFLRESLVEHYFPHAKSAGNIKYNIFDQIHEEIVAEQKVDYAQRMMNLEHTLKPEEYQEEVIMRSAVFRKDVLRFYNYTCTVSGLHITSIHGAQLVDACHIVPFSESRNDLISNGLCLSPNIHRAFDRHLVYIDDDFRFRIASNISEKESSHAIKPLEGKMISLPEERKHWPAIENLRRHREQCFK
jgi:putative restriction endonuclease